MEDVEKIRAVLEKSGLTREKVAKRLGVSTRTLGSWLNNRSVPRDKNIERVRRVYNEIFGKKAAQRDAMTKAANKKEETFTRKSLNDILLNAKMHVVEQDEDQDEKEVRKKYYDGKLIALTLEKQNRNRLILFPSISKQEGEWYKMGGNSALFYLYYIAPRTKKNPKIRQDTDIKYRFRDGVIMVHWGEGFIDRVEKLGLKVEKIDYGLIVVQLDKEFTVAEIKELRERVANEKKRFYEMVMPKENLPDVYGLIRKLAQILVPKVKRLDAAYRGIFGERLLNMVMDIYEGYYRVANGMMTKAEGYQVLRGKVEDMSGMIMLADEVEWFDFTTRTRVGETLVDLKAVLERRLLEKSED